MGIQSLKKQFLLLSVFLFALPTFASLNCGYFLSHIPVSLEGNERDSGNVVSIELGPRGAEQDFISYVLAADIFRSDRSKKPSTSAKAFSRLDALLIENQSLFQPAALSANLTATTPPLVSVTVERREREGDLEKFVKGRYELKNDASILKITTRKNSLSQEPPYFVLELDYEKHNYQIRLASEADSLIFMAGARQLLVRELMQPSGQRITEASTPFQVRAGHALDNESEVVLPEAISIGSDYKLIGIEQYRSSPGLPGHTDFYLRTPNRRSVKVTSFDYETGMKALEMAAGSSVFSLKVTQHEALPGDNRANASVNVFKIITP